MSDTQHGQGTDARREPDFSSWIDGEQDMHGRRFQLIDRAVQFAPRGWLFAREMTHGDDTTKEQAAIALASLMTDQYLVTSDDNPRLMHITDEGVAWHQARAAEYAAEQAIASPAV